MFTLLIVIAALVLAFLAYVAFKPSEFRAERSMAIDAPAVAIFPLINDLHNLNLWNPLALSDPQLALTYSRPATDAGAAFDWNSAGRSGSGRIQITNTAPASKVTIDREFVKPFTARNVAEFSLVPAGRTTTVIWATTGCNAFFTS